MKELFLYVSSEGWKSFQYENLSDLDAEFKSRGISIGYKASIGDGVVINNTIFLTASRHPVYYYGLDCIHIGCHRESIQYWLDNYQSVGKNQNYSDDQIVEYGIIIKMISELHKTWAI